MRFSKNTQDSAPKGDLMRLGKAGPNYNSRPTINFKGHIATRSTIKTFTIYFTQGK